MIRWLFHWSLRFSYSSELGAATAYAGHEASLVGRPEQAGLVAEIRLEELAHRAHLLRILHEEGVGPFVGFEWFMWTVGSVIALGCRLWGPWVSALGAAVFEVNATFEFTRLSTLAQRLDHPERVRLFDEMAAQEARHQRVFAQLARGDVPTGPRPHLLK